MVYWLWNKTSRLLWIIVLALGSDNSIRTWDILSWDHLICCVKSLSTMEALNGIWTGMAECLRSDWFELEIAVKLKPNVSHLTSWPDLISGSLTLLLFGACCRCFTCLWLLKCFMVPWRCSYVLKKSLPCQMALLDLVIALLASVLLCGLNGTVQGITSSLYGQGSRKMRNCGMWNIYAEWEYG